MSRRAQSTMEYAVVIGVMVAALIAMQVYLKRGIQGRMRQSAEQISTGLGYSPGATISNSQINLTQEEHTNSYTDKQIDSSTNEEIEVRISEAAQKSNRVTNRQEEVLSFSQEPARW